MRSAPEPSPTRASLVAERIARHRDPVSRLRVRHFGADVVRRRAPTLELYYEPGDPHSHLCAQLLPMLTERVRTRIDVRLVGESAADDYPERERQRAYAMRDAIRIAPARGLRFPAESTVPDAAECASAASVLARATSAEEFARLEPGVAATLFGVQARGQTPSLHGEAPRGLLEANAARRARLGHYLPAVWQLDGDWFWGVDRLRHLEARLRERGLLDGDAPLSDLRAADAALPELGTPVPALEFFYSFRSPYSFLAALRMREFEGGWPSAVRVRPVLPMAMRSISVPRAKRMYTLRDVKREALLRGIPFGRVADPLGAGARRCLQVFPLAASTEQQLDFLVSAGQAVWSEGVDVSGDKGLAFVCDRAGIDWDAARKRIAADVAIEYAEDNRRDLLDAGLWGVPCYRAGGFTAWGQDRFWMLPELLRRARTASSAA
jgi:2-hydroxychromene-2-carboxylate isomerase